MALSNLLVFKNNPSYEINVSLIQSKNHGYPAIAEYVLNNGLFIIKLSVAIKNSLISSSLSFSSFVLSSFSVFINFDSMIILFKRASSFTIKALASISSIFSSVEHTKEISFSSPGSNSISYLPGTAWFSSAPNPLFSSYI